MRNQAGILASVPKHARYLMFSFESDVASAPEALAPLADVVDGSHTVVGIGPSLVTALDKDIPGLRPFPSLVGPGFNVPSTQYALWFWLRGEDRGELHHRSREIEHALAMDFQLKEALDGFMHQDSRDLTGYIDGTENPVGDAAVDAAIVQAQGEGLDGSSFVAVQQWVHDFELFEAMTQEEQDNAIGRRKSDNEELRDAPVSAHVKRTAQESFDPEAFMVRRSMPWTEGNEAGLNFVAFCNSLNAFEVMMRRMAGQEDDVADALFAFTRPISGAYYWCPPMVDGQPDLRILTG